MTVQPDIDTLIRIRAKELGITLEQAYEIYKMPFYFAKHVMELADSKNVDSFKSVYIKGMGVIAPKKRQIIRFNEIKSDIPVEEYRKKYKEKRLSKNGDINNDK